jgi:hypothetical protein
MSKPPTVSDPRYTGDLPVPSPRHVQEFQELYEKRFGVSLSSEQALSQLINLLVIVNYRQHNFNHMEDQRMK